MRGCHQRVQDLLDLPDLLDLLALRLGVMDHAMAEQTYPGTEPPPPPLSSPGGTAPKAARVAFALDNFT